MSLKTIKVTGWLAALIAVSLLAIIIVLDQITYAAIPAITVVENNGTCAVTERLITPSGDSSKRGLVRYTLTWVADADGVCNADITGLEGSLVRAVFNPGNGNTLDLDYTLVDGDEVDIFAGLGADRHNIDTQQIAPRINRNADGSCTTAMPDTPIPTAGTLEFGIINTGNAAAGVVQLFFLR